MDKKIEFDLNVIGPKETLKKIIERAGYKYSDRFSEFDTCIKTIERAHTKKDVIKFINAINRVTELNLVIVGENEVSLRYHTKDGRFGGETYFISITPKDDFYVRILTNFELVYSEEGLIFT